MDMEIVKKELIEKAKAFVENVALPQIEVALEKEIEAKADGIVEMVLNKVEALIPGPWDNMVIDPAPLPIEHCLLLKYLSLKS